MIPKLKALKKAGTYAAGVAASFGGFLLNAQPPEGVVSGFSIGFPSAICVMICLAISVIADMWIGKKGYRSIFLGLAIALMTATIVIGLRYQTIFAADTIRFPDDRSETRVVIGSTLTDSGRKLLLQPAKPVAAILADAGGVSDREILWTRSSITDAVIKLNQLYIAFAILLSSSVFCLLEGLLPGKG
jgi:hypothetical protein